MSTGRERSSDDSWSRRGATHRAAALVALERSRENATQSGIADCPARDRHVAAERQLFERREGRVDRAGVGIGVEASLRTARDVIQVQVLGATLVEVGPAALEGSRGRGTA